MAKQEKIQKYTGTETHGNPKTQKKRGWVFYAVAVPVIVISTIVMTLAIMLVHAYYTDVRNSRAETARLLEIAEQSGALAAQEEHTGPAYTAELSYQPHMDFDAQMREINPDFICWIRIDGTPVDYPVVRGRDNIEYLDRSFFGEENLLGTLFMDYRNVGDFVPHIIIYGHMSRYGDKFGGLLYFLYDDFLEQYNTITLIVGDRVVEYEIFSARITDIHDYAYFLDFSAPGSFAAFLERIGAPPESAQILTLSTCLSAGDDDGRIVVQAALIG